MENLKKLSAIIIGLESSEEQNSGEVELANDEPICIHVNGEYFTTLIATPNMFIELTAGYLLSSGLIKSSKDVRSMNLDGTNIHVELTDNVDLKEATREMMNLILSAYYSSSNRRSSSDITPFVDSNLVIKPKQVVEMFKELNSRGEIYNRTRGTHSAMICNKDGTVLAFSEDVGRHNAVDKVVGALLLKEMSFSECVLLSTGRQSSEMILKAARAGVQLVASMAVPLVSGVRMAEKTGITLVSLIGGKLHVYSENYRVSIG